MALVAHEFGTVLLAATGIGALCACLSALGASRIYQRVGRGYLDVADADPVEQSGKEPLELTEVREMVEATAALRRARRERSRARQAQISDLLRQLEGR
jgi:hypothetical protein